MQPDLLGLEINLGEIKGLTGVRVQQVYRPAILKTFIREGIKTLIASTLLLLSCLILTLVFPDYRQLLVLIHGCLVGGLILEDCYKIILSIKYRNLIRILDDIDRYHGILKAIDLNDQLEAVGNSHIHLTHREQIISAMKLLREDLIRAMKTEKILRKNKNFLIENDRLFTTNLTALTGLQINVGVGASEAMPFTSASPQENPSTQQGRLLNEALQIATHVQAELKQLQNQHSKHSGKLKE